MSEFGGFEGIGGVLGKATVIGAVIALHCRNDQGRFGPDHVVLQTPAFTVGRILVEKDIVAVKHVKNRITALGMVFEFIGNKHIGAALLVAREFRNGNGPFLDHGVARFLGVGYPTVYHIGKNIAIAFWIFEA